MSGTAGDYAKGFALALLVEAAALISLLPGVASTGTRHSPIVPKHDLVVFSEWLGYVLHLPTVLLTFPFKDSTLPIIFLTPVGQIVFFTPLFGYLLSRKRAV